MTALTFCVLLQATVIGAEGQPYSDAYKTAQAADQPLVVLVGAEWCPGCVTMKRSVIPGMIQRGKLRNVQFTVVDTDEDPALARKLMQGTSIPQLIVYSRNGDSWRRTQLTGPKAEAEIEAVINSAVQGHVNLPKLASETR